MRISVVICTYNRSGYLRQTLESLKALRFPESFAWEIVVVDNNSADDTQAVIKRYESEGAFVLRGFFEKKQGLSNARNRGIQEAAGEILAFLDDDTIVDPDWLASLSKAFREESAACVAGKVKLHGSVQRPIWWHADYDSVLGQWNPGETVLVANAENQEIIGIGANMSFLKRCFSTYGSFDPDLGRTGKNLKTGEETEMTRRLIAGGEKVIYHPAPLVHHCPDTSRFTKQYLRRWYYRIGEYAGMKAADGTKSVLGMPRWRMGRWLDFAVRRTLRILSGNGSDAFRLETKLAFETGYLAAKFATRAGKTRAGNRNGKP